MAPKGPSRIRIKQVDAFTTTPHTGNPAGVVLEAKDLTERQMQSIAREMNVSETAFLLPPSKPGADLRLRWFTPTTEVPLCGHATIATFHAVAEEGLHGTGRKGSYAFRLETASGILPVEVTRDDSGVRILLGLRLHVHERVTQYKVDLLRVLNIQMGDYDSQLPIARSDYLFVPVRRLHTLFSIKPNYLAIANFLSGRELGGMCVYTTETIERESAVHSRFFAPHIGINEDPVTGSSHNTLAALLYEGGVLKPEDGHCAIQAEQGDAVGRRGRLTVELVLEGGRPSSVRVGGTAVTVLDGEMLLPD